MPITEVDLLCSSELSKIFKWIKENMWPGLYAAILGKSSDTLKIRQFFIQDLTQEEKNQLDEHTRFDLKGSASVVSNIGVDVTRADLSVIRQAHSEWYTDTSFEIIRRLADNRQNRIAAATGILETLVKVHSTFFFQLLCDGPNGCSIENVMNWTINPFKHKLHAFPYHFAAHWMVLFWYPEKRHLSFYNGLGDRSSDADRVIDCFLQYLCFVAGRLDMGFDRNSVYIDKNPSDRFIQTDSHSCGPIVSMLIFAKSEGFPILTSNEQLNKFKERLANAVLSGETQINWPFLDTWLDHIPIAPAPAPPAPAPPAPAPAPAPAAVGDWNTQLCSEEFDKDEKSTHHLGRLNHSESGAGKISGTSMKNIIEAFFMSQTFRGAILFAGGGDGSRPFHLAKQLNTHVIAIEKNRNLVLQVKLFT